MPKLLVNNTGIYYEVTGQGEPLLFIHGLASSSRSWKKQVPAFSRRYRVITFDIRGHGRSEKRMEPYSIEMFAADARELLRELGADRAHVVGFSMGGMVAFQLAVEAPKLVRSLVAVNCCPEPIRTFNDRLECVKHLVGTRMIGIGHKRQNDSQEPLPESGQERRHQSVLQRMAVTNKLAYANAFNAVMRWGVADQLDAIKCPTLMLTSDEDFVPVSIKEGYASRMPNAELVVISNSRHGTPRERTEEFNAVVLDFVSKH
jgi:pimeloyl-ACP methyl ester carboxylesterase